MSAPNVKFMTFIYTYLYVEKHFNVLTVTEVIITGQNKIEAKGSFLLRYSKDDIQYCSFYYFWD